MTTTRTRAKQLTPHIARELLAHCIDRGGGGGHTVNEDAVKRYSADMLGGRWNTVGIMWITPEGLLFDGVHRCHAVIDSGVTIPIIIVTGEFDTFKTLDSGQRRTMAQMLKIEGYEYSKDLGAAINAVASLHALAVTGKFRSVPYVIGENRTYTPQEKFLILDMHPDLPDDAKFASLISNKSTIGLAKGWIAGVRSVARHVDAVEHYDEFCYKATTGESISDREPEFLLRRRLLQVKKDPMLKLSASARNGLWDKAWNMRYLGEEAPSLKHSPTKFVTPIGLIDWHEETWVW